MQTDLVEKEEIRWPFCLHWKIMPIGDNKKLFFVRQTCVKF